MTVADNNKSNEIFEKFVQYVNDNQYQDSIEFADVALHYGLMSAFRQGVDCAKLFAHLLHSWSKFQEIEDKAVTDLVQKLTLAMTRPKYTC